MIGGLVEVADEGRYLCAYRGFLKVLEGDRELGRVPLDDITALILSGSQITLSKALMVELAERKAAIVTCGHNWHPIAFSLPYGVYYETAGVLQDQINASEPLRKRLWQQVVRAKINNQAVVLRRHVPSSKAIAELEMLRRRVKSGDPDNLEAQAARRYWPALMGEDFRRDRWAGGVNVLLNYGYTILRAATARATCGSGLHPALGLHHGSRMNAFALVDDLMEPFRPLVDSIARDISNRSTDLEVEQKRTLASVLQEDVVLKTGHTPVVNGLVRLAQSLVASLANKKAELAIAAIQEPIHLV